MRKITKCDCLGLELTQLSEGKSNFSEAHIWLWASQDLFKPLVTLCLCVFASFAISLLLRCHDVVILQVKTREDVSTATIPMSVFGNIFLVPFAQCLWIRSHPSLNSKFSFWSQLRTCKVSLLHHMKVSTLSLVWRRSAARTTLGYVCYRIHQKLKVQENTAKSETLPLPSPTKRKHLWEKYRSDLRRFT